MTGEGGKRRSYRDLEVYQLAHAAGVRIHEFSLKLPKYELYETGSQLRRAAKSVSANIVEGYGRRRHKAEFIRFLGGSGYLSFRHRVPFTAASPTPRRWH